MNSNLETPPDPDAVTGGFRKLLAVQGAEKIAQAREADDQLVAQIRLAKVAGEHDGSANPGVGLEPVLHDFRPVIVESGPGSLLARLVYGALIRAWHARVPHGHSGKSPLLPGNLGPIHEAQEIRDLGIGVVIMEELFKDV